MPTSEDDVLDLLNRAAIDPPSMHLAPQAVLGSAQARRGRRRRTRGGMALAAVTVAATVWLGLGSGVGDLLGDDIEPATPIEWDETVAFEADLPTGDPMWQGFLAGSLVREPGADFEVELPDNEATVTLQPVEGDVPDGVALFTNGGASLIVSEGRFDGLPTLNLKRAVGPMVGPDLTAVIGVENLDDGTTEVHAWLVTSVLEPEDIRDIYWLLPDQVAASSGDAILNEVVEADGEEVPIMIVVDTGQWTERTKEGMTLFRTAGDPFEPVTRGDLSVTVLPGDAEESELTASGEGFDSDNRMVNKEFSVPMSTRAAGDYLLAWASVDQDQFVTDSGGWVDWPGQKSPALYAPEAEVTRLLNGQLDIQLSNSNSSMTIDSNALTPRATIASDGSALALGPLPDGISTTDGPFGEGRWFPDVVLQTDDRVAIGSAASRFPAFPLEIPTESPMVGVGLPPGSVADPNAEILPTLLFEGIDGVQWAGQGPAEEVDVGGRSFLVAVNDDLGVWAANCHGSIAWAGQVGAPHVQILGCQNEDDSMSSTIYPYAVMVLPSTVAEKAQAITTGPGTDSDLIGVSNPMTFDLGDGLSLWAVSLDLSEEDQANALGRTVLGVDLDGDGTAD